MIFGKSTHGLIASCFFLLLLPAIVADARGEAEITKVYLKRPWLEGGVTETTHEAIRLLSSQDPFTGEEPVGFHLLIRKDFIAGKEVHLMVPGKRGTLIRVDLAATPLETYPNEVAFFLTLASALFSKAVLSFSTRDEDVQVHCRSQPLGAVERKGEFPDSD